MASVYELNPQVPFSYTGVLLFSAVLIEPCANVFNDFVRYVERTSI